MKQDLSRSVSLSGALGAAQSRVVPVSLGWRVKNFIQHGHRSTAQVAAARLAGAAFGLVTFRPSLRAQHFRPSLLPVDQRAKLQELLRANTPIEELARHFGGHVLDFGVVSSRVVTTAGVGFLVDAWQNLTELENLKYHGVGTGTNAEASGDTTLQTESTTALNPDSTRATGSTTEGASANIFRTVGTVTFDAGAAITEHGIFSQAATGGGTLWDRSVFSAINVISGDSIQFTYDMTATAGS